MINQNLLNNTNLKGLKFIDLFAGIGGFHLALKSFGMECVFSSEWDKNAQEVYFENHGIVPNGDITKIDVKDIASHDILCGGFPCQAFSISGKQKGFEDSRGTLFFDIVRIAKHHKPKILFLENVFNFEKHDNGRTLEVVLKTLDELGYTTFYKVLNAVNFGVPQVRKRIYFVSFLKELNIKDFSFPNPLKEKVKLIDFLENETCEMYEIKDNKLKNIKLDLRKYFPEKDLFGDYSNKDTIRLGTVNKGGQGDRIYSPYGSAITLSAYGGGTGSKTGLYYINGVIRKLTPRECANISGFPKDFKLPKNKNTAYKQFGNTVIVDVLQYILIEINLKLGQKH
jgi:DNA (cytosine-5)-methyltransferase 1